MKTYRVFIGLGSNLGDRGRFLQRALTELRLVPDLRVIWTSGVYETEPWGKADQPRFLNACVEAETPLLPPELLDRLLGIEQRIGRSAAERWGPREIDLDILLYDGLVHTDGTLTVPHPELEGRRFALIPLREIAPDIVHPVSGLTVRELADACPDRGSVKATTYHLLMS